ncbi:hypothetical protein VTN02DRAFT_1672 [Thermoascus thermophilus]
MKTASPDPFGFAAKHIPPPATTRPRRSKPSAEPRLARRTGGATLSEEGRAKQPTMDGLTGSQWPLFCRGRWRIA